MWSGVIYDIFKHPVAIFRNRKDFDEMMTRLNHNYDKLYIIFEDIAGPKIDMTIEREVMRNE